MEKEGGQWCRPPCGHRENGGHGQPLLHQGITGHDESLFFLKEQKDLEEWVVRCREQVSELTALRRNEMDKAHKIATKLNVLSTEKTENHPRLVTEVNRGRGSVKSTEC